MRAPRTLSTPLLTPAGSSRRDRRGQARAARLVSADAEQAWDDETRAARDLERRAERETVWLPRG